MSDISYALPHTGKDITVPMVVLTDCHCRWHAQTWIWDYYRIFATWNPGVHATLTIIPCFCIHLRQTIKGSIKRLIALGEVETNQMVHIHSRALLAYP